MVVEHVFKRNFSYLLQLFYTFVCILLYHVTLILIELDGICFGESTQIRLPVIYNTKDRIDNNLNSMEGIYREGWRWGFPVKFPLGVLIT